jgi:hypothetical protein
MILPRFKLDVRFVVKRPQHQFLRLKYKCLKNL